MRVLITDFDLFGSVGGGQTYYRRIFERNPQIEFFYFRIVEPAKARRPANAHGLAYGDALGRTVIPGTGDPNQRAWLRAYISVENIAAAVAGQRFDIVEIPDYQSFGGLLAPAFEHHQVGVGRFILSLHGSLSRSIALSQDWNAGWNIGDAAAVSALEVGQYKAVDVRYGISRTYLEEWRSVTGLAGHFLNPLSFLKRPEARQAADPTLKPDLNFVGRLERLKGPDLFINLVWWLPRAKYEKARLIGSQTSAAGLVWQRQVEQLCRNRTLPLEIRPIADSIDIARLFYTSSITVVPSRWDSLNLVSLESLLSGCPTLLSKAAGAYHFLHDFFPNVPLLTLDPNDLFACVPSLIEVLDNYADYRRQLVQAVQQAQPELADPDIGTLYKSAPEYDPVARAEFRQLYSESSALYASSFRHMTRAVRTRFLPSWARGYWYTARDKSVSKLLRNSERLAQRVAGKGLETFRRFPTIMRQAAQADAQVQTWRAQGQPAASAAAAATAIRQSLRLRLGRSTLWGLLAETELAQGRGQTAAVYWLRMFRFQGQADPSRLTQVMSLLVDLGYGREAEAARVMYSPGTANEQASRCYAYLEESRQAQHSNPPGDFEFVADWRTATAPRVSVVVSMYRAETKVTPFLKALCQQTLAAGNQMEVIFIDAGSPQQEYKMVEAFKGALPIIYARTHTRETIQAAWNRGIGLARAPYLSFLGVDETLIPVALERLAAELDQAAEVDWVVGNSVMTDVDAQGAFVGDVMTYDRTGYNQDLVYLETCYLSWVGALYRRSIHDRFGYYDASFRAAGDTEFKNRVLPFIKSKHLPEALGVFWNYPEERTTAHPRAELEDLRAWYLHRTLGGVRYAFERRPAEEAAQLFRLALRYRKSYVQHESSDVDYAVQVGAYLRDTAPATSELRLLPGAEELLRTYRALDNEYHWSGLAALAALGRAQALAAVIQTRHRSLWRGLEPVYRVSNDNRYEQHNMIWEGEREMGSVPAVRVPTSATSPLSGLGLGGPA